MRILKRLVLVAAAVVAAFLTAAATLDFQLGRTSTSTTTGTAESNAEVPGATQVCPTNRVYLHVEDREGLGGVLAWEMRKQLQDVCGFTVTLVNNAPGPDDYPLVLVAARNAAGYWTPFYAEGSAKILAKFCSNTSDVVLDNKASTFTDNIEGTNIIPMMTTLDADVEMTFAGVVSLPAYRRGLCVDEAREFATRLRNAIDAVEAKAAESGGAAEKTSN